MSERKIVLASTSAVNGVCDSEGFNHKGADSSELVSVSAARHMASGFPVLVKSHCLTVLHLYVTFLLYRDKGHAAIHWQVLQLTDTFIID